MGARGRKPRRMEEDGGEVMKQDEFEEIRDRLRDVFVDVHDLMLPEVDPVLEAIISSAENSLASARQALHAYSELRWKKTEVK